MKLTTVQLFICILGLGLAFSCNNSPEPLTKENKIAMAQIIIKDDSLGRVRDQACLSIPLSNSIKNYVTSIQTLDYSKCPSDFKEAIDIHLQAWTNTLAITDKFPDARGKLLDLFKTIQSSEHAAAFLPLNEAISETWTDIDKVLERE